MFLLFHAFIALVIFEIPQIQRKFQPHRFALFLGSLGPDLIDKPLSLISEQFSGRGYGHTPLLQITLVLGLIVYEITSKRKDHSISKSYGFGALIHLILDIPSVPWLYPVVKYEYGHLEDVIGSWTYALVHNPKIYSTELIGLVGFVYIGYKNQILFAEQRFIHRINLKDYLFKAETRI